MRESVEISLRGANQKRPPNLPPDLGVHFGKTSEA